MLQKLVDQQVLILAEDSHFDKLKKASAELNKRLSKDKAKVLAFVYVAIDSQIQADSPEIKEVQEIVTRGWTTFASAAKDSAVGYIRCVILEALESLAQEDSYASLIYLAAKNVVQYNALIGAEKGIIQEFLTTIGDRVEQKAERQWDMTLTADIAGFKSNVSYIGIDKVKMEAAIKAAAAATDNNGENPASITSTEWPAFFAKKATTGIYDEVSKTVKSAYSEVVTNQIALLKYLDSAVKSQDVRSKLIWWKESGYSELLKKSYRELNPGILELALTADFSAFLPQNTPASARYFLLNTYRELKHAGVFEDEIFLSSFLSEVLKHRQDLGTNIARINAHGSRISLLEFLSGVVANQYNESQLEALVGIKSTQKIKTTDLLLWLYEDNQVEKILNQ